jgi:regulator of sigma E protease
MSSFLGGAWPWILTIAGFAFLIIIHEFGHFIAAKATGMRVERFFLFFPPKLVSVKRGETEYGIGALPFGGFVKITGMNPDELDPARSNGETTAPKQGVLAAVEGAGQDRPREPLPPEVLERAYYKQPVWKRIVVIGAGPTMNVLLAFLILFAIGLGLAGGLRQVDNTVGDISPGTPAAQHLQSHDRIIAVDGKSFRHASIDDRLIGFRRLVAQHRCAGKPTDGCRAKTPVHLRIERNGRVRSIVITPVYDADIRRTRLGFTYGSRPEHLSFSGAASNAASEMWRVTSGTVGVFSHIFESKERKKIHGIVGISDVTHQAFQFGPTEALTLIALISLSLAIINLFPFLPLDGGHIFWSLVEKVRGRAVPFSVMERASAIGFVLVMVLFAVGLSNDISKLNGNGFTLR